MIRNDAYFKCGSVGVLDNHRAGSTSICTAILETFYPDEFNEHFSNGMKSPRRYMESAVVDECSLLVGVIRDPVERFVSACLWAREYCSVDDVLAELELQAGRYSLWKRRPFGLQVPAEKDGIKLFRFPDQLEAMAAAAGITAPIRRLNVSRHAKPSLSCFQEERVREIYADDFKMWAGMAKEGAE